MTFKLGDALRGDIDARPCWRKQRWTSQGAAEAQLRSIMRRSFVKGAEQLNVYKCPHCHDWHVGHNKHQKKRRDEEEP